MFWTNTYLTFITVCGIHLSHKSNPHMPHGWCRDHFTYQASTQVIATVKATFVFETKHLANTKLYVSHNTSACPTQLYTKLCVCYVLAIWIWHVTLMISVGLRKLYAPNFIHYYIPNFSKIHFIMLGIVFFIWSYINDIIILAPLRFLKL